MLSDLHEQYITDAQGKRIAVVLNINTYQKLLEDLDEFYCLRGYEQGVAETEPEILSGDYLTLEQYVTRRKG